MYKLFNGLLLIGSEATNSLDPLTGDRYLSVLPNYEHFSFSHR